MPLGAPILSCITRRHSVPQRLENLMADPVTDPVPPEPQALVAEDLIEEVSIDGMCGVY